MEQPLRFLDKKEYTKTIPEFVKRQYGFPIWWLVSAFLVASLVLLAFLNFTVPSKALFLGGAVFLVLVALASLTAIYIHKNRDMIMATEFQSALFAAAARAQSKFCLILKHDGTVIYSDASFRAVFKQQLHQGFQGLEALLSHQGIKESDKDNLLKKMTKGVMFHVPFELEQEDGRSSLIDIVVEPISLRSPSALHSVNIEMHPLDRNEGFVVIRGRSYDGAYSGQDERSSDNLGLCKISMRGKVTELNQAFTNMTGYTKNDFENGKSDLYSLISDQHLDARSKSSIQLMKTKHNTDVGLMILHSGNERDEDYHGIAIPKELISLFSASQHDSTRKQSIDGLFDHSPIATALIDDNGVISCCNQEFSALTNGQEGEVFVDLFESGKQDFYKMLAKQEDSPGFYTTDINLMANNGTSALLYLGGSFNGDHNQKVIHLLDTTEQKNLELRFVHSQKMQAVGQLAGGIAHDFNNLLTAIMGFCDLLLLRHPAGDPSFADIMQIKQNSNRAANLVRQLLAFSRKQTMQPEILDVTDVLAELSNLVRRLIGENIELKMLHGRDLGLIKVDLGQLEQVVINLAVNARDAMLNGGVLSIKTSNFEMQVDSKIPTTWMAPTEEEHTPELGEYVLLEVVDSGTGIPEDIIDQIFEPFFSTKETGSGTGLGLATVYGIIKQTGGYIFVESIADKGTTFSILLKSYRISKEAKQSREEVIPDRPVSGPDLTGKGTILLVEDEAPVRTFSAQALTNKGYTVLEADSAESALKIIKDQGSRIELIVTDVVMPGMNGPTMVEEIIKNYPDIQIIFISGYAEDAFLKTYGSERSFNFLPKPFTLKQLASKVKEVMGNQEVA